MNVDFEVLVTFEDRSSDNILHPPLLFVHNIHPDPGIHGEDAEGLLAGVLGGHHGRGAAEITPEVCVNIRSAENVSSGLGNVEPGRGVESGLSVLILKINLKLGLSEQEPPDDFLIVS